MILNHLKNKIILKLSPWLSCAIWILQPDSACSLVICSPPLTPPPLSSQHKRDRFSKMLPKFSAYSAAFNIIQREKYYTAIFSHFLKSCQEVSSFRIVYSKAYGWSMSYFSLTMQLMNYLIFECLKILWNFLWILYALLCQTKSRTASSFRLFIYIWWKECH